MTLGDLNYINHIDFFDLRGNNTRQKEIKTERKEEELALYFARLGKRKLYEGRKGSCVVFKALVCDRSHICTHTHTHTHKYKLRVSNEYHVSLRGDGSGDWWLQRDKGLRAYS